MAQLQINTGQKVSAGLHVGLLAWIMLFDLFAVPDAPMIPEVTEVALISAQDFAELSRRPVPAPEPSPEPAPVAVLQPITPPPPIAPSVTAPAPEPPQAAVVAPQTTPDSSLTPVQRPAERVAPEAAPVPDPQVAIAPRDQAALAPEVNAVIDAPNAREATQREAAATETVTEATRLSETEPARRTATAPEVSLRPRRRPPTPQAAEAPPPAATAEPTTVSGPSADAIENALAQALAGGLVGALDEPAALSQADRDMLRLSIESCWNVGILSTEALNVVITIAFEMTPDARPVESTIRQVSASGGSAPAQQAAFDAGRQAIAECGIGGYGLPQDLYDQWRLVEITFNPARMINR